MILRGGDVSDTQMVEFSSFVPPIGVSLCYEPRIRDFEFEGITSIITHHLNQYDIAQLRVFYLGLEWIRGELVELRASKAINTTAFSPSPL